MKSNSLKLANINIEGDLPVKPCGIYLLIELVEVEEKTESGIVIASETIKKEQVAEPFGYLRAVGPTAFYGWENCKADYDKLPYQKWGLEIGDMVEFRRYEGKHCSVPGYDRFIYIPDSHIVGVVSRSKGGDK